MTRLCIDFGGTNIKLGVATAGEITRSVEFPVTGTRGDLAAIVDAAAALGATANSVDTVAMAVPGLVDEAGTRMVLAHGKYDWMMGADLDAWAQESYGAIGLVENDARAALLGEVTSGCAIGESDAAILVLGTGIGTAVMLGGAPLRGASGAGGNLGGHMTIDWSGPVCNCGNVGCAEVFGGSWGLRDRLGELVAAAPDSASCRAWIERLEESTPIGFVDVFTRAAAGDDIALLARERAITAWSIVVTTMCHLTPPATVIIAGGVARAAKDVVPSMAAYVDAHIWDVLPRPRFAISESPETAVLRGLAVLEPNPGHR